MQQTGCKANGMVMLVASTVLMVSVSSHLAVHVLFMPACTVRTWQQSSSIRYRTVCWYVSEPN
jgi:hypothetical protein